MRTLVCLAALSVLGLCCGGCTDGDGKKQEQPATGTDSPFVSLTFEQALAKAKEEKKLVFVDFYADWCGPCKMLDKNTWTDATVKEWLLKNTIAVKVDVDKFEKVAAKHKVVAMPTMILLSADGKEVKRVVGYRDAKAFLKEFGPTVKG